MSDLLVVGLAYLEVFVPPGGPPAPGEERFVDGIKLGFGGALNSASVAAALGVQVSLCVPMGEGIADHALARLAARLGIRLVPMPAGDDPAISLVYANASERAFVSAAEFDALDQLQDLPPARWVHVPGLEEAARLTGPLAAARRAGARIAVSGSWSPVRLGQLARQTAGMWDLLVLNEMEAQAACGDVANAPDCLAVADSVIVTRGAAGAFGRLEGVHVAAPGRVLAVVEPTGAGDAFCAGLLAAQLRGLAPQQALEQAGAVAAHILKQRGGLLDDPLRMAALAKEFA